MLKVTLLEIIFRGIPEEFLAVFAIYSFSKTAINIKKYLKSSVFLVIIVYLIRFLPIQFGVHTILIIIAMILITVNINKIDTIKCIKASIISIILESLCEGINIFIIQYVFKLDVNHVFQDSILKTLYGIPSLLIFASVVTLYYVRSSRRGVLRDAFNGEISE